MGAPRGVAPSLAPRPVPPALPRSTPGDKVHARRAPNTQGPRGGRLRVIWMVLFCFCPYPGAHWFLSSWRGGRAGVFPRRPVSPSLTSRPAARWPPRAEPRETPGARGTPGVVVHRGPRGLGRWGRRGWRGRDREGKDRIRWDSEENGCQWLKTSREQKGGAPPGKISTVEVFDLTPFSCG